MRDTKVLKSLIYIIGAICLCAFISIRFLPFFNQLLKEDVVADYWDKTKYGELYYFSMISHFKEHGLPPAKLKFEHSPKHASVQDCEVLTFGDSYFEFSRHKQIPERLADDFHKKVHYVNNDFPLTYLENNHYQDTVPKLVIFERVERYLPIAFEKKHEFGAVTVQEQTNLRSAMTWVKDKVFYAKSEELYDAMLKRSYLTTGFYAAIATIKFDLFGYISKLTPTYLKDGENSWLFYHDQVNTTKTSFYYQHSQEEIENICNNMADLSLKLKERYNMDLVYLPLPAKYTLYHHIINNDPYNNFLPRLYQGLDERNVRYINVFEEFRNSSDFLYYRTDDHWKEEGIQIAYQKTLRFLRQDPLLAGYISGYPGNPGQKFFLSLKSY